jgi:hypothetical protein
VSLCACGVLYLQFAKARSECFYRFGVFSTTCLPYCQSNAYAIQMQKKHKVTKLATRQSFSVQIQNATEKSSSST